MTNQDTTNRKARKGTRFKFAMMGACYLCVLALAISVDGMVEAQAEYRELSVEAEIVRSENLEAVQSARTITLALQQQNAELLAEKQQETREELEAEAEKQAELAEAAKAREQQAAAAAAKPVVSLGKFNAEAYANGFSGVSKVNYWKGINSDTIGYLYIPGTNISHPVLQNTSDVNYYTHLNVYKNYDTNGVLWTNPDTNSAGGTDSLSPNTVIYGHNWTNYSSYPSIGRGSDIMFAQLTGFHHLSMAKTYPYFYYATSQETMTFKIFSCFYSETSFAYNATSGGQWIIDEALQRSRHNFGVQVDSSDKIITLSTCTRAYGATNQQRFVVMGRLLRPGETVSEVNVVNAPNHKQPSV